MTKGEKKYLISSAIVFGVGLVIMILGIICGGIGQYVNAARDIGSGALEFASTTMGFEGFDDLADTFDPYANLDFDIESVPVKGFEVKELDTFKADEVDNVYVIIAMGDVNILASKDDCFGVDGEGKGIRYFMKDRSLYITADAFDGDIYYPNGIDTQYLCLSAIAGDIEVVADITAENVKIHAAAGNIEMDKMAAKSGEIILGAGNLEIDNVQLGNVSVKSIMGNITLKGAVDERLEVAGVGNVELMLQGEKSDYNYALEATVGNVTIGDSSWSGAGLVKRIDNDSNRDIVINTTTGNIEVSYY